MIGPRWKPKKGGPPKRNRPSIAQAAYRLLLQVALALSVFLDRHAGRFHCRREVLHRVTTLLADLVTELESFDFSKAPDTDAVLVGTTPRGRRGRHDAPWIVILRTLVRRILDDIVSNPMRALFGVLLPDVASYSSQLAFLVRNSAAGSFGICSNSCSRGERSL